MKKQRRNEWRENEEKKEKETEKNEEKGRRIKM